jgi:hypothetical protein
MSRFGALERALQRANGVAVDSQILIRRGEEERDNGDGDGEQGDD